MSRSEQLLVRRHSDAGYQRAPDEVAVEEPLEIRLDDHPVVTTMRTPGDDVELAIGLLYAEGLLDGIAVRRARHCTAGLAPDEPLNVVVVETGGLAPIPTPRLAVATAACGLCGSTTIATLTERLPPLASADAPAAELVAKLGERVLGTQSLFARTGGVHAAAAVGEDGEPVLVREDVGRHNAVDKVVGRLHLDNRLPADGLGLFVSGRAGFELVQKAWAARFGWMVAVGAPTSLAVSTARQAGLVLIGFSRNGTFNVYSPAEVRA
ncbi:MAG: formate dehydrogenase accessory sulfurtransferase FdhD [Acidimicrobiia bacterium]